MRGLKASALGVSRSQHRNLVIGKIAINGQCVFMTHLAKRFPTRRLLFSLAFAKCAPQILWLLMGIMLRGGFYREVSLGNNESVKFSSFSIEGFSEPFYAEDTETPEKEL